MKKSNRIISLIIAAAMAIQALPAIAASAEEGAGAAKTLVSADSGVQTVSIVPRDITAPTAELQVLDASFSIARDYNQKADVSVQNATEQNLQYYLAAENRYTDIYLNFAKSGSKDDPLTVAAGEGQTVELTMFAQNTTRASYDIRVTAYIIEDGVERLASAGTVTLDVAQGSFNVSISAGSRDQYTLAQSFTITNNSSEKITDLTLELLGDASEYAKISPGVINFELGGRQSVAAKVVPDLTKFNDDDITMVSGQLRAFSGANGITADVSFDTQGKPITSLTIGQLAQLQDGNPFYNITPVDGTFAFATKSASLDELADKFLNQGEMNGVDTAEEIDEVLSSVIDKSTGEMYLSYSQGYVFGEGYGSEVSVSVEMESTLVPAERAARAVGDPEIEVSGDTVTVRRRMSEAEYFGLIANGTSKAGEMLDITNYPGYIVEAAGGGDYLVAFTVRITGDIVPDWANPLELFSKGIMTGSDLAKVAFVLASDIDTSLKIGYTALQAANQILRYGTDGIAIEAALWLAGVLSATPLDGVGTVVGFIGGFFLAEAGLGLLDMAVSDLLELYEEEIFGSSMGSIFNEIFGGQCTNAGKTTAGFSIGGYVPTSFSFKYKSPFDADYMDTLPRRTESYLEQQGWPQGAREQAYVDVMMIDAYATRDDRPTGRDDPRFQNWDAFANLFNQMLPVGLLISPEYHYFRNELNVAPPTLADLMDNEAAYWKLLSIEDSKLHMFDEDGSGIYNLKFVSKEKEYGMYEAVYSPEKYDEESLKDWANYKLCTPQNKPNNMGTYNYGGTNKFTHFLYDIAPFFAFGNTADTTDLRMRDPFIDTAPFYEEPYRSARSLFVERFESKGGEASVEDKEVYSDPAGGRNSLSAAAPLAAPVESGAASGVASGAASGAAATQAGVRLFVTSRMFDGNPYSGIAGYANEAMGGWEFQHTLPVTYDYYLNGHLAGKSRSAGLTEVDIVELPAEYLKEGQNVIVNDYNTNAGHYKVTTDTQITLLVPFEAPVSYIGSPESLDDVRNLPDFAIYDENIVFAQNNAIVGELNQVKANVYNRGGRGGWATITASDGAGDLFKEENAYIPPFSAHQIEFGWLPSANAGTVFVTLENASAGLAERFDGNNSASRSANLRSREVPVIGEILAGTVYADEAAHITVEVADYADVAGITYSIDGGMQRPAAYTAYSNKLIVDANATFGEEGEHEITFAVSYYTSKTDTGTVSKSARVSVLPCRTARFSVQPSSAAGLQFYLLRLDDSGEFVQTPVEVVSHGGGSYSVVFADEALINIPKYFLFVTSDAGSAFASIASIMDGAALVLRQGSNPSSSLSLHAGASLAQLAPLTPLTPLTPLSDDAEQERRFFGGLSLANPSEAEFFGGDVARFRISGLADAEGNAYSAANENFFYGSLTFTGSPNTSESFAMPVLLYDLADFYVALPNREDVNGQYTFSIELTQDPKAPYADAVAAPEAIAKSGTSISLRAVAGYEYSIDGGATFQDSSIFGGLSPGTAYAFVQRAKETGTTMASGLSQELSVATKALFDGEVADPIVAERRSTSITLAEVAGYEYSIDNGATFQDSNVFASLSPNTTYSFVQRAKETDAALASPASGPVSAATTAEYLSGGAVGTSVGSGGGIAGPMRYRITVNAGEGGAVAGGGDYESGKEATIMAEPDPGYVFEGWYEGGAPLEEGSSFAFVVTANRTFEARFVESPMPTPTQDAKPTPVFGTDRKEGYLSGYPDGTFKPDDAMSRYEAVMLFYTLAANADKADYSMETERFADADAGEWYAGAVGFYAAAGFISGYPDGTFKGDNPITRAEFVAIAARFKYNGLNSNGSMTFADVDETHWAYGPIKSAYNDGWIYGYPDNTFSPESFITRAEAVAIINRMLGWDEGAPSKPGKAFPDLDEGEWYYNGVMQAANGLA